MLPPVAFAIAGLITPWLLRRVRLELLIVVALILVGPLVLPLMAAFKAPGESVFGQGATMLPQHWSLDSFYVLFERTNILVSIKNSAILATLTVTSNVILSCIGGYMLSRRGWTGRSRRRWASR